MIPQARPIDRYFEWMFFGLLATVLAAARIHDPVLLLITVIVLWSFAVTLVFYRLFCRLAPPRQVATTPRQRWIRTPPIQSSRPQAPRIDDDPFRSPPRPSFVVVMPAPWLRVPTPAIISARPADKPKLLN